MPSTDRGPAPSCSNRQGREGSVPHHTVERLLAMVGAFGAALSCAAPRAAEPVTRREEAGPGAAAPVARADVWAASSCPSELKWRKVPTLDGVQARSSGKNARITFEPRADAADYRVYALPKPDDVTEEGVRGAVYRCAGGNPVPAPAVDDEERQPPPGVRTRVAGDVEGFVRAAEGATLGYVFTSAGPHRIPVYALGDPDIRADNTDCYEMRWPESRKKRFVTSEAERSELLSRRYRDDGVAFYVPEPGSADTVAVYEEELRRGDWGAYLYTVDTAERLARREGGARERAAFAVHGRPLPGTAPLMRVYYALVCGHGHDELVAGEARFRRARYQGNSPVTELHYSGLGSPTWLVVEALDEQCPFQGVASPLSRRARVDPFPNGSDVHYPALQTFGELAASSRLGELFLNGQKDGARPKAIARACVKVEASRRAEMDFFYDGGPEPFGPGTYRNFQNFVLESPRFDVNFYATATDEWAIGDALGELWVTYADWAADTNGKVRITPKTRAELTADAFVHATMEVDMVSTQRRYPQLLISSAMTPVQEKMVEAETVIVQPIGGINTPVAIEVQFCDRREWDVNNQCPTWDVQKLQDAEGRPFLSPRPEVTGWMGGDRTVRFDVYTSTARVFVFTNGLPYACVELPSGRLRRGPATVTFGDVLYHSSADLEKWYPFHSAKMHVLTTRHFSNLGFSSRVPAPAWDEHRIPCVPSSRLK